MAELGFEEFLAPALQSYIITSYKWAGLGWGGGSEARVDFIAGKTEKKDYRGPRGGGVSEGRGQRQGRG